MTMGLKHWSMLSAEAGSHEFGLAGETFEGRPVAYLRSSQEPSESFGLLHQVVAADEYRGQRVRLSAVLKAAGVTGWAGLWLRVEGGRPNDTLPSTPCTAGLRAPRLQSHANVLAWRRRRTLSFRRHPVRLRRVPLPGSPSRVDERVPVTGREYPRRPRNLDFQES